MFFAILALFSGTSHAKYKKAEALMDVPGKKPVMVEVNTTGSEQLVFNYKIPEADLVTLKEKFDGESVKRLYLGNAPLTNDEGKPVLPVIPAQFIIPAGKTIASVQIERNEKTILWGKNFVEFGKAKIPLIKDAKFKKSFPNPDIYQKDDAYPSKNGSLITIQKKRGVNIGIVNVNPVQYHPKSGKLVVYSNVVVHIILKNDAKNFKSTIPAKVNTLNPSSLGVENPEAIETYKPQTPSLLNYKTNGICASAAQYSYVLITSQSICDAKTDYTVHDLINQRLSQGVTATIVTIEEILKNYTGVDDAEKLRNFIIDAYTNWNTQYVTLGGDVSIIPYRNLYSDGEYIPSDLYFQCLDGSYNSDGDLYWGESTDGEGGGDVDLMSEVSVGRISAETPEEMANFIYKTITYENLPSETSYLSRACIAGEYLGEQFGPGEFSFATPYMEEIRKGSSTSGYTTKGFTDCSAFSEDTVYDAPSFEWSKDSILNIINTGKYSIINHLGHANETYVMKFENNEADRLTNKNPLFAYSQGCYPGHFPLDCMAEHLTTSTRSGMFAVVFNSVYGYGGYNESKETLDGPSQRFDRQFWDGFFNETIFRIGDLNADSHEDNLWCINTDLIRYCMYETTLFGDPYTMLRGMIQGPSLVCSSQTISDLRGNNDQIVNPGESIDLSVTVKNIGSEASQIANCVLTGTDPYVTIRSSTSSLPAINCCGTSQPLSTPLQLDIKSDCPTPYTAPFTLSISSGDSTWNLNVSVNVFRSSAINGLILANTGDTPIQGATVYYKGPVSGMISSGADGSYSCKLIEGTYSVWVNAAGYLSSDTMFFSIPPAAEYNFRMYRPHLSVTPATIAEELKTDDSLSVNVTLDNTGDAPLNVVINNRLISKPLKTGNPKLIESLIPHSDKRFFSFKKNKNTMIPNMYKPERYDGNGAKVLYLNSLNLDSMKDYFSEGLRQLPVVASLDIVDGTRYTPNLEYLMQYDCVILSSGDYWADAELLGNTLADYADNGKLIVLLAGTFATGGDWQLKGRIAEPEYMPLTMGSGLEAKCVANNFADHKLTSNIKNISTMIIVNSPSVQGNGVALGYYNCDSILAAAYNASYPIVAINVIPVDGYWGGDVITMVSNSIEWAASEQRWLQVEPENKLITILPGASKDISVNLNSLTLIGGLYTGEILFTHNDPSSTNPVVLPVSMIVDGFRSLSVNPESITFDPIWYGNTDTASITLINNGSEATSIQSITSNSEVFSCIQSTPLTVKPRKTAKLSFVFNPTSIGNFPGTIKISSNAEDNSTIDVPVSATATEGPSASVSPDALSFSFQPKDVPADRTVVLSNTGAAPLGYSVRIRQTGKPVFVFDHNKQSFVKKGLIYNKQNYTHPFVENTVLVGMKQGKTTFAQSNLLNQIGIESVTELAKGINPKTKVKGFTTRTLLKMKLYSTGKDAVLSAIRQISKDPNVEYAEPDYIVKAINTPNDEYFSRLYAMNNQGQTGGKVDADIDAVEAWDSFTGNPDDILIGVIDTGIDYLHPDLVDNIWKNPGEIPNNGIDDDGNGFIDDYYGWDFAYDDNDPDDQHGHGTHVSGTIAGKGNNGIGVTGVMWNARVMALKFLDASGSGTTSDAIDAVNYATIMNVQVTNNSWGGGGYSQALEEAIASSGIFVAAAGNNGTDNDQYPEYPGSYTLDNIISVAATDHNDSLAYFSCYGRNSVDLSAPGVDILSSLPGNNYDAWSGTSMATPHVTGAVALLWSNNSSLTSTDVKSAILQSVDKIPSLENRTVSGGRLNIQKMLELAGNSWLTIAPKTADTLQSSGTKEFTITANPEKMEAGHWTAEVTFKTDDPFHKDVTVNVSADVAGCKSVETSGETVSFGKVWVNRDTVVNITLANTCNDMVTISGCSFENPAFKTNVEFPIYIKPFGKIELPVTFAPESSGPFNSQAIISSDAEDNPSLSVNLAGVGLTPPTITLNPSSIMKNLHFGSVDTSVVALTNSGEADYHFKTRTKMQKNSNSLGVEDATLFGATWNTIFKIDPNTGNITDSIMISDSSGSLQEIAFDGQYIYYSHSNAITVLDPETKMIVKTITFTDKYYYFGPIGVSDEYIYVFDWVSQDLLTISKMDDSIINTYGLFSMIDLTYSETRNSLFFTDYNNAIYEINPSTGEVLNKIDNVEHLMSLGFSSAADLLFGMNWDGKLMALNPENGSKVKEYPYNPNYFRLAADEVTAGPKWLDVNPEEGIVSAASSFSLNTMFDTRKLFPGTYNAAVVLSHRFGLLPDITIPCTLSVDGENRLRVNPTAHSFNEVWKGRSDSSVIYLVNDGNEATTVSSVIPTNTVFSTSFVTPVTIDAFDSVPFMVRCYPTKLGITQGTIKITSNADDHPLIKMDVKVSTVKPPKISINPGSISVTMLPGQQVDHFITVKNTGGADYAFKAKIVTNSSLASNSGEIIALRQDLVKIDPATGLVTDTILDSANAYSIAYDGNLIYLNYFYDNYIIQVVDPEAKQVVKTIQTPIRIRGLAVSENYLFATSDSLGMYVLNKTTGEIILFWNTTSYFTDFTYCGDRGSIYTFNFMKNSIEEYNSENGILISSIPTRSYYNSLAYSSSMKMLLGSNKDMIDFYDPETGSLQRTLKIDYAYSIASDEVAISRWIATTVTKGVITKVGGVVDINLHFNSTKMMPGVYNAMLIIEHDKGWTPGPFVVNCKLKVNAQRLISVSTDNLSFGTITVGDTGSFRLELTNDGNDTTTIRKVSSSSKEFALSVPGPFVVPPFSKIAVDALYIPFNKGKDSALLTLKTDASNATTVILNVKGEGITGKQNTETLTEATVSILKK
jgi:subtilisin family serine protease